MNFRNNCINEFHIIIDEKVKTLKKLGKSDTEISSIIESYIEGHY